MLIKLEVLLYASIFCIRCVFACTHRSVLTDFINSDKICLPTSYESFPTVLVVLLVRNKAHILPHVLAYFEKQNYPKKRMILWMVSDHNRDSSGEILKLWARRALALYHNVALWVDEREKRYKSENGPFDWTLKRRYHHMRLKEDALDHARQIGADYAFFLDADVLLTNEDTISHLVSLRLPIVTPFLQPASKGFHFKVPLSRLKLFKNTKSLLEVTFITHAVLIHINWKTNNLTFNIRRLFDYASENKEQCLQLPPQYVDFSIFSSSAMCARVPMFVNHEHFSGYFLQPKTVDNTWEEDLLEWIDLKLDIIMDLGTIAEVPECLQDHVYTSETIFKMVFQSLDPTIYGKYVNALERNMLLDEIYMINLDRRPERRTRMEKLFAVLAMEVTRVPAVDPKSVDILKEYNITLSPEYTDPSTRSRMSLGEIGCFLSHYSIWKRMVAKKQEQVLIFEDDVRFGRFFKVRLILLMEYARALANYDLLYLGRLRGFEEKEPWFRPKNGVQYVDFSYWTIGYILTLQGAEKLLAAKPLERMMPVDKFLPLMYGGWDTKMRSAFYTAKKLIALGPKQDLITPVTDQQKKQWNYISDTKDSMLI